MHQRTYIGRVAAHMLLAIVVSSSCKVEKPADKQPADGEVAKPPPETISAHTSGVISRESTVRVRFVNDVVTADQVNKPLDKSPFEFAPTIDGIAVWTGRQELQFRPKSALQPGQKYSATIQLADLVQTGPKKFEFSFACKEQSYEIQVVGLEPASNTDIKQQIFRGSLRLADVADPAKVKQMVTAKHGSDKLVVQWDPSSDRRNFRFSIKGIDRGKGDSTMELAFSGKPIGIKSDGVKSQQKRQIAIAGLDNFSLMNVRAVGEDERYIELRFSDPLLPKQNLRGLIKLKGKKKGLRYTIENNLVKVYSSEGWNSQETVVVSTGVRNIADYRLKKKDRVEVSFESLKPAVRFASKGVIIPTTQGTAIPIEVANVRAIYVEALRVYASNLPQFLQVNSLDTSNEMVRVGRTVWRDKVELSDTTVKSDQWLRFGLDISQLVKNNPKGLYRIKLSFSPADINYDCDEESFAANVQASSPPSVDEDQATASAENSYWDNAEEDYWQSYENRQDPCSSGYYKVFDDHDISASRNVMISDLGLMAKRGNDGSLLVITTDIKTAQPLQQVAIKVLDFQQQVIGKGTTDKNGTLRLQPKRKPFVVVAQQGEQTSVVKLDDGSALAVGHFDVSGAQVQKGLKGFLFGERGVWRPGDDIYLTFMLYDASKRLPEEHPVHFELVNSRGQSVARKTERKGLHGFYVFRTKTAHDAPTGNYIAKAKVGGATFSQTIPVETIKPNRLKIEFDFGSTLLKPDATLSATLKSKWLHGAIADGLDAQVDVSFTPKATRFDRFKGYDFDDPTRHFYPENETIFEGSLDENGETLVEAELNPSGNPPGMLTAHFKTRIFEPSGSFSVDRHSIPFAPYQRFIGIRTPKGDKARGMLLTDTKHKVQVVAVDADGKATGGGQVELKIYKIDWRWWWEKGTGSLADYAGSSSYSPISQGRVQLKKGKGSWQFEIKYPDWGRYLVMAIDQDGQHRAGKIIYVDWPGWAGRAQKDQPGGASVLTFASDKKEYAVGEKVTLTIPTGHGGRGLVSLESGSRVVQTTWIEANGQETAHTFEATADMAPNVFAHVTFLQPHLKAKNDLPIRLYGVIPLKVFDPSTKLAPKIECADVFQPQSKVAIKVTEAQGKAMTYTLAVVDEGLLGLTRHKTADPWAHFYRREALGVRSWDVFNMVAGAYGGSLEKLLAIGGDGEGEEGAQSKARRFPAMVRFMGPFALAAGADKVHEIDIPQYIGAVRVMLVAGQNGAFGSTAKEVLVKKPLMVAATLPRVLGPGETVNLPVSVFALEERVKKAVVKVDVSGPVKISGAASKKVTFSKPGDKMITFKLKVQPQLGVAHVTITGQGGGETSTQKVEIAVRHPGRRVVDVVATSLEAGKTWQTDIQLVGMAGTNKAHLEVSRIPPLNLGKRLDYLVHYPHGCVEQTTSGAFPQVYLSKLLDLPEERVRTIEKNVKGGINRLKTFQHTSGGFGFWPGGNRSHDWGTSYAGHFLVEAKRAGFLLPQGMLNKWVEYQSGAAQMWTKGQPLIQAYRLYTLALAGSPALGAMNRLKESEKLETRARWRLAAAYQLAGQPEVARQLTSGQSTDVKAYNELGNTFGSDLRDLAMILESLVLLGDNTQALTVAKKVSQQLSARKWLSTQEAAYALVAMARFASEQTASSRIDFSYALNGGAQRKVVSDRAITEVGLTLGQEKKPTLVLSNNGQQGIYPRVVFSGLPKVGKERSRQNRLAIELDYEASDDADFDIAHMEQGRDFVARVTVTNIGKTGTYREVALSHLVPSGWEIHNTRLDPGQRSNQEFDYQDIRDDRVYTYFDLKQGQSKSFELSLNAAYLGKFYMPMVSVEAMYDATINARQAGQWVEVVSPGPTM